MRTLLIRINCDCGAYTIRVRHDRPNHWRFGPRCRGCRRIVGPMNWSVLKEHATQHPTPSDRK